MDSTQDTFYVVTTQTNQTFFSKIRVYYRTNMVLFLVGYLCGESRFCFQITLLSVSIVHKSKQFYFWNGNVIPVLYLLCFLVTR